jgi:uncharacterized membrane protein YbhN (UPF0104 family)
VTQPAGSTPDGDRSESGRGRYARVVGLVVLVVATGYGLRELGTGNWREVVSYWQAHLFVVPVILGFAVLDVALEGAAWVWVYQRFGLQARDATGLRVYLAANAGKLLPAQLGRLIRPDAMVRLGRGTAGQCLKAEGTVFVLDSISVVALLAGLLAYRVQALLAPVAALSVVTVALFVGDRIARPLAGTRLDLPPGFWWNRETFAIAGVQLAGWVAHGLAFWAVVAWLPGSTGMWDALVVAPASAVFGVATGLPGGIGATEGALGVSLSYNGVPTEHLAIAVLGFRVLTFWLWVFVGWVVLLGLKRRAPVPSPVAGGRPEVVDAGSALASRSAARSLD